MLEPACAVPLIDNLSTYAHELKISCLSVFTVADHACSLAQAFTHTRLARAHKFRNMSAASFDGQLTRANVGLAVRSGLVTEAEAQHYWEARYRHTCLSDSNSKKTSQARTADF